MKTSGLMAWGIILILVPTVVLASDVWEMGFGWMMIPGTIVWLAGFVMLMCADARTEMEEKYKKRGRLKHESLHIRRRA